MAATPPSTALRVRPAVPTAAPGGRAREDGTARGRRVPSWGRPRPRALLARTVRAARGPLATVVLSCLAAGAALRIWDWRPGTPVDLSGDSLYYASQVRAVLDGGAWDLDPHLGAPFGQVPGFFTTGDDLHLLLVRVLGLFSDSPFTVAAVYFLLGFPASALTAYWLARRLGTRTAPAVVVGVLFSVVPAHQTRYAHLFLAAYWAVPLGMWLVVTTARGGAVLRRVRGVPPAVRGAALRWNLRSLALVATVGLTGVYYAAFTAILLAAALVVRRLRRPGLRPLLRAAVPLGLLLAVTGGTLLRGRWTTRAELVTGDLPGRRTLTDTELFSGKLLDLVLPWSQHRDAALAQLTTYYHSMAPGTFESSAVGLVATVGCGAVLLALARAAVRRPAGGLGVLGPVLGLLLLTCLAFYVRGGLGSAVALFLTAQLRTWSRLFLLVALLGLLAVGLLLGRLVDRRRVVGLVVCAAVLAVGVWDQTNPAVAPDWAAQRARLSDLTTYTDRLTAALPAGCAVFEAPVLRFPENGPQHAMGDYDPLLPTLTGRSLRWSYGAMRGTARSDWQLALPQDDPAALVDDLAATGFCAVQVDRAGYAGDDPSAVLQRLLGAPLAVTSDGRLRAFDLRPRADALRAREGAAAVTTRREAVLHPVVVDLGDGASPLHGGTPGDRHQWLDLGCDLVVGNLTTQPQRVTVTLDLTGVDARERVVTVSGGATATARTVDGAATLPLSLTVPPGASHLVVRVSGPSAPVAELDGGPATGRLRVTASVADPAVVVGVTQRTATDPGGTP